MDDTNNFLMPTEPMLEFYNEIKKQTSYHSNSELVSKFIQRVAGIILKDFHSLVSYAADTGNRYAYIYGFDDKFMINDVKLIDLIDMNGELADIVKKHNIHPLVARLELAIKPFVLVIERINMIDKLLILVKVVWN
jgi:hypothetical protein